VVAERNQVLEAANTKWAAFYKADGNMFEQAVQKRLSAKAVNAKPSEDEKPKDKDLNGYKPGSDGADKDAEKQANAYQNLTKAIQAKIVQANLELSAGAPLLASQQEQLSLTERLAEMKGKLICLFGKSGKRARHETGGNRIKQACSGRFGVIQQDEGRV